jgi:hypothetical protein
MNGNQGSEVKKFIKVLVILVAGVWLADFVIGGFLAKLYKKQKSGLLYRTSFAMDSTRADYLVLGSSRANHDYDPHVFESKLKVSFYNCGRDKQGLLYSCAVLSAILERYQPKAIIIDIRPDEFTQSDEGTLATLLPYFRNPAVRPFLDYNSHFENIKLLSRIYPYNSLLTNLVVGLKQNWAEDYQGYRPLNNQNADESLETFSETGQVDFVKLKAFGSLLERVAALKIPAFLVISPIHYRCVDPVTVGICARLATHCDQFHYLNFTNAPAFMDNKYYSDNNHLNAQGAAYYSAALADMMARSLGPAK